MFLEELNTFIIFNDFWLNKSSIFENIELLKVDSKSAMYIDLHQF